MRLTLLILTTLILTGCLSSTDFQPWQGQREFVGKGGACTTKDGIDIWTVGEPQGRFEVLGVAENTVISDGLTVMLLGDWWSNSAIVDKAKELGADAVIFAGPNQIKTHSRETYDHATGGQQTVSTGIGNKKAILIKYLEPDTDKEERQ